MADDVRDVPPRRSPGYLAPTPLGVTLDDYRSRLVPGKAVLMPELTGLSNVRSKYLSVRGSKWSRTLVPGYVVVPNVANSHVENGVATGDLWLTLKEVDL